MLYTSHNVKKKFSTRKDLKFELLFSSESSFLTETRTSTVAKTVRNLLTFEENWKTFVYEEEVDIDRDRV